MLKKRLIACLLWQDGLIVQTVNFIHTNFVGNAFVAVDFFNSWAIDEIIILDISPSEIGREKYYQTIQEISRRCFVPLTVGGKIKTTEEIRKILSLGADKICINSQAFKNPRFVTDASQFFGAQCVVVSIDVRLIDNNYRVFIENGTLMTELSPFDWARQVEALGAGELFLTSIDRDGSRIGYDLDLLKGVADSVKIPVIASAGVGSWEHLAEGIELGGANAVSAANIFHYSEQSTKKAKNYLKEKGIDVREPEFYKILTPRKPVYKA